MRTQNGVRILALAPAVGQPAVQLNEAALQSNSYPLGRHLWLLLRPSVEPWMREFLQFVLSDEGRRIVDEGSLGYRALSVEDCEVERAKLQ
jgi:ABC-type phosphate transport system substrate-binding protein